MMRTSPSASFDVLYDVQDVAGSVGDGAGGKVFGGCDDCKIRVWDVTTTKLIGQLSHHKMPIEVVKAK